VIDQELLARLTAFFDMLAAVGSSKKRVPEKKADGTLNIRFFSVRI